MFTGIVRELGVLAGTKEAGGGRTLVVRAPETAARTSASSPRPIAVWPKGIERSIEYGMP